MRPLGLIVPSTRDEFGIRDYIEHALIESDVSSISTTSGSSLADARQQGIKHADFIIADVTGYNPDVMYVVGFAQALRKPVMLITRDKGSPIPAPLRGDFLFFYDPTDPDQLQQHIKVWVSNYLNEAERRRKVG